MRKPTVLFINRVYPPARGATGRVLRDLAQAFARDGWAVTVLTSGSRAGEMRDGNIRVLRLKSKGGKTLFAYAMIWLRLFFAALRLPRHQLVVTLTDPPLLVVAGNIVSRLMGAKHIHWCHDLYPDILPIVGLKPPAAVMNFLRSLSRRAMKSCDRVVVVGRCMARHLTMTGMDMTKVTVIPNWTDQELVAINKSADPIRLSKAANDHPVTEQLIREKPFFVDMEPKFRVLYAGNLGRAHPIATIVEAATLLQASNPEIEFVFVGDGPGFDRIAQERSRRELDNIRLLPHQPPSRLKGLMESGDVHLVSMKHEAAGMLVPSKMYAALAAGRPCIFVGPEQSEPARVLSEYHAGTIVAQGDASGLAQAILRYRLDSETWFRAFEGATRAGQDFGPEGSIQTWLQRARDTIRYRAA
jgi:colanic acid biosynthesis glycosyl transferase WcaI